MRPHAERRLGGRYAFATISVALSGCQGTESLASPKVLLRVGWLDHRRVVRASSAALSRSCPRAAPARGAAARYGGIPLATNSLVDVRRRTPYTSPMEMARKSRMAAVIVAAATGSCSKSATVDTTVADSAGVAIVTNSGTPTLLDWTLDTVRVFGGDDSGPATFHLVRSSDRNRSFFRRKTLSAKDVMPIGLWNGVPM